MTTSWPGIFRHFQTRDQGLQSSRAQTQIRPGPTPPWNPRVAGGFFPNSFRPPVAHVTSEFVAPIFEPPPNGSGSDPSQASFR